AEHPVQDGTEHCGERGEDEGVDQGVPEEEHQERHSEGAPGDPPHRLVLASGTGHLRSPPLCLSMMPCIASLASLVKLLFMRIRSNLCARTCNVPPLSWARSSAWCASWTARSARSRLSCQGHLTETPSCPVRCAPPARYEGQPVGRCWF